MGKDAKVVVRLSVSERIQLEAVISNKRSAKDRVLRARMLMKADADADAWSDSQIAETFEVSPLTVARLRHRCVWEGLEAAISRRPPSGTKPRKLDGVAEAQLVALACGPKPDGRSTWTMQLLADKLVELKFVDAICDETVRLTLKKTNFSRGGKNNG
jgi:transposase